MSKSKKSKGKGTQAKSKPIPHKTLKKSVQQVSKTDNAETIADIGKGKKVATKNTARAGSETSIKNRLLPPVLAEFAKDSKSGKRRTISEIAELVGFDAKQVLKYVSHYEKSTYLEWKALPKQTEEKADSKKAEPKEKSGNKKEKVATKKKEAKPTVVEVSEETEEETSAE